MIEVIGHTVNYELGDEYDLENRNGEIIHVICVDGGIAMQPRMLEFDGDLYERKIDYNKGTVNRKLVKEVKGTSGKVKKL